MSVTISSKGQMVIPAKIRKRYHLTKNSKVEILDTGHSIVIRPVSLKEPFLASYGKFKGKLSTKELFEMRKTERFHEEKELKRRKSPLRS